MIAGKSLVLSVLGLAGALSGCAVLETYHKCGLSGCPGDAQISAEVHSQFHRYAALQPPNLIRVQTFNRVVYLSGLVNTTLVRDLAGSVAAAVPGAPRVVNSISLEYQGR